MPTEVQIYKDQTIVLADLSTGGPKFRFTLSSFFDYPTTL
jgi:hypothetical protein